MKRVWGLIMALVCLMAGCIGMADEPRGNAFWWDVTDAEITTQSSGTGGKPGAFVPEGRHIGSPNDFSLDMDAREIEALDDEMSRWAEAAFAAHGMEIRDVSQDTVDGRLMQETYWEWELVGWEAAVPRRWRMRSRAVDLLTGELVGLSDLFYDGFNYIEYINKQAATALLTDEWVAYRETPVTEEMLRRPFSGFPRDYPYFRIREGEIGGRVLELLVDMENPLFNTGEQDYYPRISIPLPDTVSPYGVPWADVTVDRSDPKVHVARVSLPEGKDLAVEARINAALRELSDQARRHPMIGVEHSWDRPMVPTVMFWNGFLCASYQASQSFRQRDQAQMAMTCLSLETGLTVDGEAAGWPFADALERYAKWLQFAEGYRGTDGELPADFPRVEKPDIETSIYLVGDGFSIWSSTPEDYVAPLFSEMTYIGCTLWDWWYGDAMLEVLYFDPAANVEYWMRIPVDGMEELPMVAEVSE